MKKLYLLFIATYFINSGLLAQAGSLDYSFGDSGKAVTDLPNDAFIYAMALQSNGKIVTGGEVFNNNPPYITKNVLIRYNSDGTIDSSFGRNGIVYHQIGKRNAGIKAIAIQDDGKIVTAGYAGNHRSDDSVNIFVKLTLLRFNRNGDIDLSFGDNGVASIEINNYDLNGYAIAIQPDGKIVAAGAADSYNLHISQNVMIAMRFKTDGTLDSSFNDKGIKTISNGFFMRAKSLALLYNGEMLLGGDALDSLGGDTKYAIAKLTSSGKLDSVFGKNGKAITKLLNSELHTVNTMAVQKTGKIILGGGAYNNGAYSDFTMIRFNANGAVDASFGTNGISVTDFGYEDEIKSLMAQPDGKIIAAGSSDDFAITDKVYYVLARYNQNGKIDRSFGASGKVKTHFEGKGRSEANAVLRQSNGKIIAAGYAGKVTGYQDEPVVTRYLGDGNLIEGNTIPVSQTKIQIFPNPATNQLQIKGLTANSLSLLSITDRLGNVLKKVSVTNENYTWNIKDLPKGYYHLVIQSNNTSTSILLMKE